MGWDGITKLTFQQHYDGLAINFIAEEIGKPLAEKDVAKRGSVYYCLFEQSLLVVLTKTRGEFIMFKFMSWDMHPFYYDAPKKFVDKLRHSADLEKSEGARDWLAEYDKRNTKKKINVNAGDVIKFSTPFTFTNGRVFDTFELVKGQRFKVYLSDFLVRLPRDWKQREFEILNRVPQYKSINDIPAEILDKVVTLLKENKSIEASDLLKPELAKVKNLANFEVHHLTETLLKRANETSNIQQG